MGSGRVTSIGFMMKRQLSTLDANLGALYDAEQEAKPLSSPITEITAGFNLHCDPDVGIEGDCSSPNQRLCELDIRSKGQGRWLGLHVMLPDFRMAEHRWITVAFRAHAGRNLAIKPCLRSGTEAGFIDTFLPVHCLVTAAPTDHTFLLAHERFPDMPIIAPWRELVFFLPPAEDIKLAIHDLRIIGL